MKRIAPVLAIAVLAIVATVVVWQRRASSEIHYTGFVEGEERILRSEVAGRVVEVRFREGDRVPANEVIAVLDDADIRSRLAAKRQEIAVIDAEIRTQEERIDLVDSTWAREVEARRAEVRGAESSADVAQRSFARESSLVQSGASTAQLLDEHRGRRDQARSGVERARELLARTEAEGRQVALARLEVAALRQRRELAEAQVAELEVAHAKYTIRAPAHDSVVLTQFLWPAELAQPGSALLSVLDPKDKYVQVFVPVADIAKLSLGRRVALELDSLPGRRIAGEVSYVADKANFTPEKIETRSDRMGQVYRVKVRMLEEVERLQPGTEGNVYLVDDEQAPRA